jgi:hypothetical protein
MPGDILTLLCGRCRTVHRVDLADLERVPFWVAHLSEAFGQAGVRAVQVAACGACQTTPAPHDSATVLSSLKQAIEGALERVDLLGHE